MAIRLHKRLPDVAIHYDSAVQEYRVSYPAFTVDKLHERFDSTSYFTDDRADAEATAEHMQANLPNDLQRSQWF